MLRLCCLRKFPQAPIPCIDIPIYVPLWPDPFPPIPFLSRIVWRIGRALVDRFGPRPHPWLPPASLTAAGVTDDVIRDLRVLSTIAELSSSLRPALRSAIQNVLADAPATLNIQNVVEVDRAAFQ